MTAINVQEHIKAAVARAAHARLQAQRLLGAGFPGPSLVWAVRAAEILMRDFVLTPYFIEQGFEWEQAMRKGGTVLGDSSWTRAFAKAEEWYGPFDEPLTDDGSNAWNYWSGAIVRRRGDVVHGRAVADVSVAEATDACAFAERMASWFAQRFVTSENHPMGRKFRELLADAATEAGRHEH
jgi:hypothetical protein